MNPWFWLMRRRRVVFSNSSPGCKVHSFDYLIGSSVIKFALFNPTLVLGTGPRAAQVWRACDVWATVYLINSNSGHLNGHTASDRIKAFRVVIAALHLAMATSGWLTLGRLGKHARFEGWDGSCQECSVVTLRHGADIASTRPVILWVMQRNLVWLVTPCLCEKYRFLTTSMSFHFSTKPKKSFKKVGSCPCCFIDRLIMYRGRMSKQNAFMHLFTCLFVG